MSTHNIHFHAEKKKNIIFFLCVWLKKGGKCPKILNNLFYTFLCLNFASYVPCSFFLKYLVEWQCL